MLLAYCTAFTVHALQYAQLTFQTEDLKIQKSNKVELRGEDVL